MNANKSSTKHKPIVVDAAANDDCRLQKLIVNNNDQESASKTSKNLLFQSKEHKPICFENINDNTDNSDMKDSKYHPFNYVKSNIKTFQRKHLQIGKILGVGEFCKVYEVTIATSNKKEQKNKSFLKGNIATNTTDTKYYAMKALKKTPSSVQKLFFKQAKIDFENALADLATEAKVLASLDHPNIIQLYGLVGTNRCHHDSANRIFSLMIEYLEGGTLQTKIDRWSSQQMSLLQLSQQQQDNKMPAIKKRQLHHDNMHIHDNNAYTKTLYTVDIANALLYLHKRGMIYRDLKPENIGFATKSTDDSSNHHHHHHQQQQIKLFDFGLCRTLPNHSGHRSKGDKDEFFHMSVAGTRRYMAPEILTTQMYNAKADVYSLALIYYEMLSLNKPYLEYSIEEHQQFVCEAGGRPSLASLYLSQDLSPSSSTRATISASNHSDIKLLLIQCWDQNIHDRLSTEQAFQRLQNIITPRTM